MDRWLGRPARYADFSRALHLLLMLYGGENPGSVIDYTPHGCRHVQVAVGTQLALQGIIGEASVETLGHWEKVSKMPKLYDSASRVTELQTRKSISDVLRSGWRPAPDGYLPCPATPVTGCSGAPAPPALRIGTPPRKKQKVASGANPKRDMEVDIAMVDKVVDTTQVQSQSSSPNAAVSLVVLNT